MIKNGLKKINLSLLSTSFLKCCDFKTKPGKLEIRFWIEILIPDQSQSSPVLVRIAEAYLVSCATIQDSRAPSWLWTTLAESRLCAFYCIRMLSDPGVWFPVL